MKKTIGYAMQEDGLNEASGGGTGGIPKGSADACPLTRIRLGDRCCVTQATSEITVVNGWSADRCEPHSPHMVEIKALLSASALLEASRTKEFSFVVLQCEHLNEY